MESSEKDQVMDRLTDITERGTALMAELAEVVDQYGGPGIGTLVEQGFTSIAAAIVALGGMVELGQSESLAVVLALRDLSAAPEEGGGEESVA